MSGRITMKDIALRAGVSQAAVSHALRGTGKLSQATRERIKELATAMGYREDPLMSALASYRSVRRDPERNRETIAYVVTDDPNYHWTQAPDGNRLLAGLKEGAERWGFKLDIFEHDASERTKERLSRILKNRGIRGIILSIPRPWERNRPREMEWSQFATVSCKPLFHHRLHHSVTTNFFVNGRVLYRQLAKLGYKRIGIYLTHNLDAMNHRGFTAGILTEERLYGRGEISVPPLIAEDWNFEEFRAWHDTWLPDVIITQRWQVRGWVRQLGRRDPDHIGFAVPNAAPGEFDAGIHQNEHRMGVEAVKLLREQFILGNLGLPELPIELHVPGEWHQGGSLRDRTR